MPEYCSVPEMTEITLRHKAALIAPFTFLSEGLSPLPLKRAVLRPNQTRLNTGMFFKYDSKMKWVLQHTHHPFVLPSQCTLQHLLLSYINTGVKATRVGLLTHY